MNVGVVVGRFQVDSLHSGHEELLDRVCKAHSVLIVVLGVSPDLSDKRNPMDYATRSLMIRSQYNCIVLPLKDHPSDLVWSEDLDRLISTICPLGDVTLYGSRDSFKSSYTGVYPVADITSYDSPSGTQLRMRCSSEPRSSQDFRAGVIYHAAHQYPRVIPTVDVAMFKGREILVGKKRGEDKWRLPGGFVNQTDATFEEAARREFMEETSLVPETLHYVYSTIVDDWRYKATDSCIMTTLFTCSYLSGGPRAGDDLESCCWIDYGGLTQRHFVNEHGKLFEKLREWKNEHNT